MLGTVGPPFGVAAWRELINRLPQMDGNLTMRRMISEMNKRSRVPPMQVLVVLFSVLQDAKWGFYVVGDNDESSCRSCSGCVAANETARSSR